MRHKNAAVATHRGKHEPHRGMSRKAPPSPRLARLRVPQGEDLRHNLRSTHMGLAWFIPRGKTAGHGLKLFV